MHIKYSFVGALTLSLLTDIHAVALVLPRTSNSGKNFKPAEFLLATIESLNTTKISANLTALLSDGEYAISQKSDNSTRRAAFIYFKELPRTKGVTNVADYIPPFNKVLTQITIGAIFARPDFVGIKRTLVRMFDDARMLGRMNAETTTAEEECKKDMLAFSAEVVRERLMRMGCVRVCRLCESVGSGCCSVFHCDLASPEGVG